jgi:hypothetical protein
LFPLFATGIKSTSETGGKIAAGVVDTGVKFAAGVVDNGINFASCVIDTSGAPLLATISANFRKYSKLS